MVEKDFCAHSSRKAKAAKRNTVRRIAESAGFAVTPLDADKVKCLAASLKSAGYKSAHIYLAEAKLMHVKAGKAWSDLLARVMRQCLMAVSRAWAPEQTRPSRQKNHPRGSTPQEVASAAAPDGPDRDLHFGNDLDVKGGGDRRAQERRLAGQ